MEARGLDSPEREWIEPLVAQFSARAYRLAMMLVNDSELSRDIVQEAFVRLWQSPRTPRDEAGFRQWLYRTVTNLARDHHRRLKRRGLARWWPFPVGDDPEDIAERHQANLTVIAAIKTLSRPEREAIYLRFFEDTPYNEVGRIIGKTETASRVLVHRALAKLRERIGQNTLGGDR